MYDDLTHNLGETMEDVNLDFSNISSSNIGISSRRVVLRGGEPWGFGIDCINGIIRITQVKTLYFTWILRSQ